MTAVEFRRLSVHHHRAPAPAVGEVTLAVEPGTVAGIIGPNGSGKSTLLRTIYRAIRPAAGAVLIDGRNAWAEMPRDELARSVAAVVQEPGGAVELRAIDVVRSGRLPHQSMQRESLADQERLAEQAMQRVGVAHLRDRRIGALSGGERQRVMLARAVAQASPILLLDEPANHLDLQAQARLLDHMRAHRGTVIAVLHDLNLAAAACDVLHVVARGRLVASGPTEQVLTPELIADVYGVNAIVDGNPLTDRPRVTLGRRTGDGSDGSGAG